MKQILLFLSIAAIFCGCTKKEQEYLHSNISPH